MPLIKPRTNRIRRVRHICRLDEPTRDLLVSYARFIGDTVDDVINAVIESTLTKDRDFLVWRVEQGSGSPATDSSSDAVAPTPSRPDPTR